MNIFVTSPNPSQSALWLDDLRLNKMIVESAQMLSTAIHVLTDSDPEICGDLYKKTHPNHPCNVWLRESSANFWWLVSHASTMANHKACLGKRHKSHDKIHAAMMAHWTHNIVPEGELTPFSNSAANKSLELDFKAEPNTYLAYRKYLVARWLRDKRMPKWSGDARACPDWALDELRAHWGSDIPELTAHCYDRAGYTLKTQREQWAEGGGGRSEIYSCVE